MIGFIVDGLMIVVRALGLTKISSWFLGFISSAGPLATFFVWLGRKISIKAITMPIQYAVMGALVTAKIAFIVAMFTLISWTYNRFHDIFDSLGSFVAVSDSPFAIAWNVLQSIGFVDALFDTFSSLSYVWFSVLILIVSKLTIKSLKLASDEMFKISLLLGQ